MNDNKRERKTNRVNMRVSNSELYALNRISLEEDEPVSHIIRKAVKAYISNKEKEDASNNRA